MPKFMYIGAAPQPATIDFLQGASSTANQTSYTFASQNFGTASATRYIAAVVGQRGANNIVSVTIGGVAATIVAQSNQSIDSAAIAIAAVPTGATGDVVVTWNTTALRMALGLYRITQITNATPFDVITSTAANPSANLDIPVNGIALAVSKVQGTPSTMVWTGLTESYEVEVEGQIKMCVADDEFPAGETGRFIQCTNASNSSPTACFVSWG
jgi:hypothetical protein